MTRCGYLHGLQRHELLPGESDSAIPYDIDDYAILAG